MATLNISIKQEDLKLCKELIETLCSWLVKLTKDDGKATANILNAYVTLSKLLKLDDAQ